MLKINFVLIIVFLLIFDPGKNGVNIETYPILKTVFFQIYSLGLIVIQLILLKKRQFINNKLDLFIYVIIIGVLFIMLFHFLLGFSRIFKG